MHKLLGILLLFNCIRVGEGIGTCESVQNELRENFTSQEFDPIGSLPEESHPLIWAMRFTNDPTIVIPEPMADDVLGLIGQEILGEIVTFERFSNVAVLAAEWLDLVITSSAYLANPPDDSLWDKIAPASKNISCDNPDDADKLQELYNEYPQALPATEKIGFSLGDLRLDNIPNARSMLDYTVMYLTLADNDKVRCAGHQTSSVDASWVLGGGAATETGSCIDRRTEEGLSYRQVTTFFTMGLGIAFSNPTKFTVSFSTTNTLDMRIHRTSNGQHGSRACWPYFTFFMNFMPKWCYHYDAELKNPGATSTSMIWVETGLNAALFSAGPSHVEKLWRGCTEESVAYKQWWYNKYVLFKYNNGVKLECGVASETFVQWNSSKGKSISIVAIVLCAAASTWFQSPF